MGQRFICKLETGPCVNNVSLSKNSVTVWVDKGLNFVWWKFFHI